MTSSPVATRPRAARAARDAGRSRVPEPDLRFWVLKIVTTGMGETASDFLVRTFAPEAVVPVALVVLVVLLVTRIRARAYRPGGYWVTALMVSVFGTMAADVLHAGLGVPYAVSAVGFGAALAGVLLLWWGSERTLSVHRVTTDRRECFYWATVLTTFALGTAAGDLTATTLQLGYLASGIVFAILFAIPGLLHGLTRRAAVASFWTAYVLTRPLGASFADWFAAPASRGGVDLGFGPVTLVLLAVFTVLVCWASLAGRGRSSTVRSG